MKTKSSQVTPAGSHVDGYQRKGATGTTTSFGGGCGQAAITRPIANPATNAINNILFITDLSSLLYFIFLGACECH
jgi:hypothetical protein